MLQEKPITQQLIADRESLDPKDWSDVRAQGHRMLDDMFDYLEQIKQRPVWQPIPGSVRQRFKQTLPQEGCDLAQVHERFMQDILPYAVGNAHPGFMGWVHGGGTAVGMLAEMLAGGLNANLGGRDQVPIEVERQVVRWVQELFEFPETSSGLFVTGTSMANLISVLVARTATLGIDIRRTGVGAVGPDDGKLVAYTSSAAHGCIAQAMDLSGLGLEHLRCIPTNDKYQIDIDLLKEEIAKDRRHGFQPFFIAGTAGTVNTGAIDDLQSLASVAKAEGLWFHVDGAYGALAKLSPELSPRLAGIERADSIAFDFHKWLQVPYDAGFILVRDETLHHDTFSSPADYLQRETRGVAAGSPWPCDYGPDLSRGFKALKTWFTLQVYGAKKLGKMIYSSCELAQSLCQQVEENPVLELLAPVSLNIVCFRFVNSDINNLKVVNQINAGIVIALQESGIAVPSTTLLDGKLAIRVALFNHRTTSNEVEKLLNAVVKIGKDQVGQLATLGESYGS